MNRKTIVAFVIVIVVIVGGVSLWGIGGTENGRVTNGEMLRSGSGTPVATEAAVAGMYESYAPQQLARAENGKVILFFRASWCPTCRGLDADIRANLRNIPSGVAILNVNYDTATELKQKYGVTYQHTLVQVDAKGNQLAKWTGSPSLAALLAEVK